MEAVVQECPEDPDARAWLAMLIWQNENVGPSRQAVDGLLEYVEKAEPLHPGAHHYRIHLWDGKKPERALRSAALYATTAPGIAHAWHMPGHTYNRTEALRRRRLSARRLGEGRSLRHDSRPDHAIRDPQLCS